MLINRKRVYQTKDKKTDPRVQGMLDLRSSGKTLLEIGEQYSISRERVRQLIGNNSKPPKPDVPWPDCPIKMAAFRSHFHRRMKVWLWSIGVRRCVTCKTWDSSVTQASRKCRECRRLYSRERYHKDPVRYKSYGDPVKIRATMKRFRERHKKRIAATRLAEYHRLMQTPEGKEKIRAGARRRYHSRKERSGNDPKPSLQT